MKRILFRHRALGALPLVAAALVAALPREASAQQYYRREIQDYDQKRNALPKNGSMYCVPTAYVDLFRFMAAHGFSNLDKGYNNTYNSITNFIDFMGDRMGTHRDNGTGYWESYDAAVDWIEDKSNQGFFHYAYVSDDDWGLTAMKYWMSMGAMVRIGYGRYYKNNGEWIRDGGHAMALAGYDFRAEDNYLFVANPSNGDDDFDAQSAFQIDKVRSYKVTVNTEDDGVVSHTRFSNWNGNGNATNWMRIIDNMHVILPTWGGWVDSPKSTAFAGPTLWASIGEGPEGFVAEKTTFHATISAALNDGKNPPIRELEVELPGPVKDWCFDPKSPAIYVLGEDDVIHHVELVSKETKRIGSVKGARSLAVAGKKLDLFVLKDDGADDALVRIKPRTGKQTSMKLAKGVTAIEADPETLGIAALHPVQKKVLRIAPELRSLRTDTVDLPEGKGTAFLSLGRKGEATISRSDAKGFVRAGGRRVGVAQTAPIRSFQSMGRERFLVQEGNRLRTVDADGKVLPGAFDGVRPTGQFKVAQSWRAFTKADVSGRKWRDVPEDE